MSKIRDRIEDSGGSREFEALRARTPLKEYPWGHIALNAAGVGAAHALGYMAAGTLANTLLKNKAIVGKFRRMNPQARRRVLSGIAGAAGTTGALAASMASMAGQARIAEIMAKREAEKQQAAKTASVKSTLTRAAIYGAGGAALGAGAGGAAGYFTGPKGDRREKGRRALRGAGLGALIGGTTGAAGGLAAHGLEARNYRTYQSRKQDAIRAAAEKSKAAKEHLKGRRKHLSRRLKEIRRKLSDIDKAQYGPSFNVGKATWDGGPLSKAERRLEKLYDALDREARTVYNALESGAWKHEPEVVKYPKSLPIRSLAAGAALGGGGLAGALAQKKKKAQKVASIYARALEEWPDE